MSTSFIQKHNMFMLMTSAIAQLLCRIEGESLKEKLKQTQTTLFQCFLKPAPDDTNRLNVLIGKA